MSEEAEVYVLSPEELIESRDSTLRGLGMTMDELRAEAESGEFRSVRAEFAWQAFKDFGLV